MKQINIKNHTKNSLEFIFSEADKHFTDVLNSVGQTSNRSFLLFGIYISLITFSFAKMLTNDFEYFILLIGGIISSVILFRNLFPINREIKGSPPSSLISPYFDNFKKEKLEKEYLATQIHSYNDSIELNKTLIKKMVNRYSNSAINLIVFILLFAFFFIYITIECN
jgi:hypothetical protein